MGWHRYTNQSIQSELVLIYCDVDINEVNIYCCIHTHSYINMYIIFVFSSFHRLEPLLFFINSITFQFVWRDVDDILIFFASFHFIYTFFSISNFKIKIRILHMFHRLEKYTPQ